MASITKTTTNTGETRYRVRYRSPDGRSKEKRFRRKTDADRFARNVETDIDRGDYVDPRAGTVTVAEWVGQWHTDRVHLRPSTVARDESYIRSHIAPALGRERLSSLRPSQLQAWVAGISRRGYAPATVHKAAQILSSSLKAAVADGLISKNPAQGLRLPQISTDAKRFLTGNEVWQLAAAIEARYRAVVLLGAFTGLRPGELRAVTVDTINPLLKRVTVAATMVEVGGRVGLGPTKSGRVRTVSMPPFVAEEVEAHLSRYGPGPDGLVFTASRGGPMRKDNFRRRVWLPAVRATVGEPCRVHDLRHTHAALLIEQGAHPKVIQERFGHESIKTTLDLYGHLMVGLDEAAADQLDAAYGQRPVGLAWG